MRMALPAVCSCVEGCRPRNWQRCWAKQAPICRYWAAKLHEVLLCITQSAHVSRLQGTVPQASGLPPPALTCSTARLPPVSALLAKRLQVLSMPDTAGITQATFLCWWLSVCMPEASKWPHYTLQCPAESSLATCPGKDVKALPVSTASGA